MKKVYIDINADVGEGMGNEAALFPYISSCNIACGGHAGDQKSMREIAILAAGHQLKIGAHPSYPDRPNFGRLAMKLSEADFLHTVSEQIGGLDEVLRELQLSLHHIKPHGALYNDLARDPALALIFLKAIAPYKDRCALFAPYKSAIAKLGRDNGFQILHEAFCDRRYLADYRLAPRSSEGAVLDQPEEVLEQLSGMVLHSRVTSLDGTLLKIKADTYCIHGDTPNALQILVYLAGELPAKGIYLKE